MGLSQRDNLCPQFQAGLQTCVFQAIISLSAHGNRDMGKPAVVGSARSEIGAMRIDNTKARRPYWPREGSMIDRRCALCRISIGLLGGAWALAACSTSGRRPDPFLESLRGSQLLAELARLDARVYPEEGIPMLLACDNLEPERGSSAQAAVEPAATAGLAASFRHLARTLPEVRSNLTEWDVAKLVELLAERDFAAGGTGGRP